jgi:hypothetical protein
MTNKNKPSVCRFLITLIGMFLLAGVLNLMSSSAVLAASDSLEVTGDGVLNPTTYTLDQLKEMKQHRCVYSCINTWPTKKWYVGEGVKLRDLLNDAGMTEEAKLIRFTSADGYTVSMTAKELFEDKRYRFPNFKSGSDGDGHIPGDPSGSVEVEAIVALISVEGSDNPSYMNDLNSLLLMLGQRTVTEQTGNLFVKYLSKIEVLTAEPEKWDAPQANPPGGTVPKGTMITLSTKNMDDDKIYYTTDCSTPTMDSPIYNWIASRWWSARADVLGTINRPIGPITEDTTIKAITIGPGKLDSDVVTFHYQVEDTDTDTGTEPAGDADKDEGIDNSSLVIKLTIGSQEAAINGRVKILDAAPYIKADTGRTLIPVRFVSEALGADVAWDPVTKKVTINDREHQIILTVGSKEVYVNGDKQTIDCAPETHPSGRTFVPLRFVSEALKAEVVYNSGQILITR